MAVVTVKNSPAYQPPSGRIATFDNDGTLWCEKPTYFQLLFAVERLKEMVSAGGMSFVRTVSEEICGVSHERVIGSNITFETRTPDDYLVLYRTPSLIEPFDDGPGKPINIDPKLILAGGNADGDIEMLWYSKMSRDRSLQLVLNHDDSESEYAYEGPLSERFSLWSENEVGR